MSHWYKPDGELVAEIEGKNGRMRGVNRAWDRKLIEKDKMVPSVSTEIGRAHV